MIRFKAGVLIDNIRPEMVVGLIVAYQAFAEFKYDLIVTSGNDRKHSETSLHYAGQALDYRTRHVEEEHKQLIVGEINDNLPDDYDCILEGGGTSNEHIHHEWQPKGSNRV